jgi:hypothetical protein
MVGKRNSMGEAKDMSCGRANSPDERLNYCQQSQLGTGNETGHGSGRGLLRYSHSVASA